MAIGLVVEAKKSLPLSSTTMKAGKSSTSIFQTASMPSSGYSSDLDRLDAVLGEAGGRAADRAEVEAAVRVARVGDLLGAVALGQHHHRAAGGLELVDVGVHPAGRGRAERAAGVALGRLGRTGVVDGVVLEVLRHAVAGVEPLLDLGVRDVAGDDQRAGERQPGLDRVLRQLGADLVHRPVEVDPHDVVALVLEVLVGRLGQEPRRVGLELLEEDALGGDLAERLAVGRAGDGDGDGERGAVAGEPDDADVVAEVLAAELRADAELAGQLEDLLLELGVAEAVAAIGPLAWAARRGTWPTRTWPS